MNDNSKLAVYLIILILSFAIGYLVWVGIAWIIIWGFGLNYNIWTVGLALFVIKLAFFGK